VPFVEPTADNTATWDDFNRSDGNVYDGAGAALWDTEAFPGSGSNPLDVVSNAMKTGTAEAWGSTLHTLGELAMVVTFRAAPGGNPDYAAFAWGVVDSSHYYELLVNSSTWRLYHVNGSQSELAASGQSAPGTGATNRLLVMHTTAGGIEIFRELAGTWDETPVLSSAQPVVSGVQAFNFQSTATTAIEQIDFVDLSGPASPVTMYVDADHPAASDARTRLEATNPATPFHSIGAAMRVAFSSPAWLLTGDGTGDHIFVKRSTTSAAPLDAIDPGVYPAVASTKDASGENAPALPRANNLGSAPIVVEGDGDWTNPATRVKWLGPSGRFFKGWQFKNFQIGYNPDPDPANPLDVRTRLAFGQAENLEFDKLYFTRGGIEFSACFGTIEIHNFYLTAPLPATVQSLDGRGFGIGYLPDFAEGPTGTELVWIHHGIIEGVRGNDAIQAGMGGPNDPGSHLLIEDMTFHDVSEEVGYEEFFHTDSIQMQGGAKLTVRRCGFFGCADAVICSDYHNSQITVEANVAIQDGAVFQFQGYDHLVFRHNTVIQLGTFGRDASLRFYTRFIGTQKLVTVVNNILGGIAYGDSAAQVHHPASVIDRNIVVTNPGASTGYGTNLTGIPEFGESARTAIYPATTRKFGPITRAYELANTIPNPAVAAGLNLADTPEGPVASDIQGRAYLTPPDLGAFQNSPAIPVAPVPRAPYLIDRSPLLNAINVSPTTSIVAVVYPKPGFQLAAVDPSAFYVRDVNGNHLPIVGIAVSGVDVVTGYQTITLDIDGSLYPLATYTVAITSAIHDTEGSAIVPAEWSFRVVGPSGAAVYGSELTARTWVSEHGAVVFT
jgi:hypothetical protein